MKITTVTTEYGLTQSLPGYNNVKAAVSLTAAIEAGDDPGSIRDALENECRFRVEATIDAQRERLGLAAVFSLAQRYDVLYERDLNWVGVFPHGVDAARLPGRWSEFYLWTDREGQVRADMRGQRRDNAGRLADEVAQRRRASVIDFAALDLQTPAPDACPVETVWKALVDLDVWARAVLRLEEEREHRKILIFVGPVGVFRDPPEELVQTLKLYPAPEACLEDPANVQANADSRQHRVNSPAHLRELVELFSQEFANESGAAGAGAHWQDEHDGEEDF